MQSLKVIRKGLDNATKNINTQVRLNFIHALERSEFKDLKEWARAADVPYVTFHNYSAGKTIPNVNTARKIAKAAGVDISDLYPEQEKQ